MWALVRNIYIKFWEGRFIHTRIDLPPELMEKLKRGTWKIYLEDNGILISGEADYLGEPPKTAIPARTRVSASHLE